MIDYMIYLLAFIIGLIVGLLYSYKKHSEPYILKGLEIPALIIAILGWILVINFHFNIVLFAIGLFLVGFVIGERPGYGRGETLIGVGVGLLIHIIIRVFSMLW